MDEWLDAIVEWGRKRESVKRIWLFGSRAKGISTQTSDLDIAVELNPDDGECLAEWVLNAKKWKQEIQEVVGDAPVIDLQFVDEVTDDIVWPAVQDHGRLLFDRNHSGKI